MVWAFRARIWGHGRWVTYNRMFSLNGLSLDEMDSWTLDLFRECLFKMITVIDRSLVKDTKVLIRRTLSSLRPIVL